MTPERYHQIKKLFDAALQLGKVQRAEFLDHACAGDQELRQQVENLLASDEQEAGFLDEQPLGSVSSLIQTTTQQIVGLRVGPYQIREEIGRGGMGAVYLATRADDQFQRQVAIKIVLRSQQSADVLDRFRREQQILASLNHPNIARLIDAGVTPDGRPYLVMEYVDGQPIDDYCSAQNLDVPARLRLFLPVCAAVECAHRSQVIHRDLKPGNILVKTDGTVKLLDFGIAKILGPAPISRTATSMRLLTPAYASPEQVRGELVTPASDVYQLGVVLYQLLTGHPPFEQKKTRDFLDALMQKEPPPPSTGALREPQAIEGDIDAIVLKALSKSPANRYVSAEALASDIRRHLERRPVIARPATAAYVTSRYLERNRPLAALFALILAVAVSGGGILAYRWIAGRSASGDRGLPYLEQRQRARSLLFSTYETMPPDAAESTRRGLIHQALEALADVNPARVTEPNVAIDLAVVYHRLGQLQGDPLFSVVPESEEALGHYRRAAALRETFERRQSDPSNQIALSAIYTSIGDLEFAQDRTADALEAYLKAAKYDPGPAVAVPLTAALLANGQNTRAADTAIAALGRPTPGDASNKALVTHLQIALAQALDRSGNISQAQSYLRLARDTVAQLTRQPGQLAPAASLHEHLANTLLRRNALGPSLAEFQQSLGLYEILGAHRANRAAALRELARFRLRMAASLSTSLTDEAREAYQHALTLFGQSLSSDPSSNLTRRDLAVAESRTGDFEAAHRAFPSALQHYRRAVELATEWDAKDPGNDSARLVLGGCLSKLAAQQTNAGDAKAALASITKAVRVLEPLALAKPDDLNYRLALATAWLETARAQAQLHLCQSASASFAKAAVLSPLPVPCN